MSRRFAMLAVAALVSGGTSVLATVPVAAAATSDAHALPPHSQRAVCGTPAPRAARCFAHVVTHQDSAAPLASVSYQSGYRPVDLASAYQLPTLAGAPGSGPTVAIVDAYDNPNAESDLAAYRSQFQLGDCTTANGCFSKVDQTGGTSYPSGDTGWGAEVDLDIDMVSAACPACKILLVEGNTASFNDLNAAVDYAVGHASYVSNSYGANEFSGENTLDFHFNHPNVAITVSSGDNGYGVQWPAASPYVTAVGGTSLSQNASLPRGWSESAWSGAGSGCSAIEPKPVWQTDTLCGRRTVADVSAVANPNTGVAVYDSYGSTSTGNWFVYGGTSVASPFVAAVWALTNTVTAPSAKTPYLHTAGWNDVTSGSNTFRCRSGYLCQAVAGYDGPTGLGTPIGTSGLGGTVGSGTNNPPVAAFTSSCTGLGCTFTDSSSDSDGTIASYSWTFGDGGTSTAASPSHTYASGGTYNVTLQVTDNGGATNSVTHQVTVSSGGGGGTGTVAAHLVSASITAASKGKGINDTVLIGDPSNTPIAGASITVTITGGGSTATGSGVTASNGTVQFHYAKGTCGTSYTTTLTAASGTDSNGDTVTLDTTNLSKASSC